MGARVNSRACVALLLAAICVPSSAAADGIIMTCTNLNGTNFGASGGIAKPGWSPIAPEAKYRVKLAITNQKWDIIRTNGESRHSALNDGCSVGMYPNDTAVLDRGVNPASRVSNFRCNGGSSRRARLTILATVGRLCIRPAQKKIFST